MTTKTVPSKIRKFIQYKCPNCNQIWDETDLIYTEGDCPDENCGWQDQMEKIPSKDEKIIVDS